MTERCLQIVLYSENQQHRLVDNTHPQRYHRESYCCCVVSVNSPSWTAVAVAEAVPI